MHFNMQKLAKSFNYENTSKSENGRKPSEMK